MNWEPSCGQWAKPSFPLIGLAIWATFFSINFCCPGCIRVIKNTFCTVAKWLYYSMSFKSCTRVLKRAYFCENCEKWSTVSSVPLSAMIKKQGRPNNSILYLWIINSNSNWHKDHIMFTSITWTNDLLYIDPARTKGWFQVITGVELNCHIVLACPGGDGMLAHAYRYRTGMNAFCIC